MKIKRLITLGLLCLVLAACGPADQSTPTPAPQTYLWIDAPLDGAWLPLEPYKLVFHGASFSGISQFDVQINGASVPLVTPNSSESGGAQYGTFFMGEYLWTPPAPGMYLITVYAISQGQPGSPAQAQVTVGNVESEEVPVEAPEGDQPGLEVATETPTPEPQACTLTSLVSLFCRPGPGYDPVDEFTPGQSAPVVAQSEFLWQVIGVNFGERCAVPKADNLVKVEPKEVCENLPVYIPPATPVPTVSSRQQPQCNDNVDNDNDGYIDLRDPQCTSAGDNDESVP